MGLDFDELFPNRFLKAGEFKGRDITLKIKSVKVEVLEGDKGKETKGIIEFEKTPKQLVLNKTNGLCLRAMFGRDTAAWVGKCVTFYPAKIDFGDTDIAIRVRGSPDIAKDMDAEIKLARKKARTVKMLKTGGQKAPAQGQQKAAASPPAQPPLPDGIEEPPDDVILPGQSAPPGMDAETGEVPFN